MNTEIKVTVNPIIEIPKETANDCLALLEMYINNSDDDIVVEKVPDSRNCYKFKLKYSFLSDVKKQ